MPHKTLSHNFQDAKTTSVPTHVNFYICFLTPYGKTLKEKDKVGCLHSLRNREFHRMETASSYVSNKKRTFPHQQGRFTKYYPTFALAS